MILNIYSHHKCTLFIFSDKILNTARVSNIYLLPPCKCLNIASFSVYFIFFVITFFSTIFFPRNMFPPSYLLTSLSTIPILWVSLIILHLATKQRLIARSKPCSSYEIGGILKKNAHVYKTGTVLQ